MGRKQKTIGRPTKYTKQNVETLCKYIREGNTYKDSAALAGISESTFYLWKNEFSEFSERITVADAEAARKRTMRIEAAGVRVVKKDGENLIEGDWRADAWWLERRRRDEYSLKMGHDVKHSLDQGMENVSRMVDALVEAARGCHRKPRRRARRAPIGYVPLTGEHKTL